MTEARAVNSTYATWAEWREGEAHNIALLRDRLLVLAEQRRRGNADDGKGARR